jgi:STE24 endopeptidase
VHITRATEPVTPCGTTPTDLGSILAHSTRRGWLWQRKGLPLPREALGRGTEIVARAGKTCEAIRRCPSLGPVSDPAVSGDMFHRQHLVTGFAPIPYRIRLIAVLWPMLLLIAVLVVAYRLMRAYARRVERSNLETSEKVHRLQRAGVVFCLLWLGGVTVGVGADLWPDLILNEMAPSLAESDPLMAILSLLYTNLPPLAVTLAIYPSYRRLRGIEANRRQAVRKTARALLLFLPVLLWLPFLSLVWSMEGRLLVILGWVDLALLVIAAVLMIVVVNPLIFLLALDTYELEPAMRERLLEPCRKLRFRVRDVRGMRGRWQKTANAAMLGFIPPLRYVVVSDYLLDHFKDDEVDAVMAHEIAHGKQHHLLKKLGALALAVVVLAQVVLGLEVLMGGIGVAIWFALPVLFPLLLIIEGVLGIRLERKADEYAVDVVGLDPALRAINKLAELNHVRRRTGFLWDMLTQHPGIEQRLEHMRRRAGLGRQRKSGRDESPVYRSAIIVWLAIPLVVFSVLVLLGRNKKNRESIQSLLCGAAREGNLVELQRLVAEGVDLNVSDMDGGTALHCAAIGDQLEAARFLVENGADPFGNEAKNYLWPPLSTAAGQGSQRVLDYLFDYCFENRKEYFGNLLHAGANVGLSSVFIEGNLSASNVNRVDHFGRTPLHYAVETSSSQIEIHKRYLLREFSNLDLKSAGHSGQNRLFIVQKLIGAGADPNARSKAEWTPFELSTGPERLDIMKFLFDHGGNHKTLRYGRTLLHQAAQMNSPQAAEFLIEKGFELDSPDDSWWTPLHTASWLGHCDVVHVLVTAGANSSKKNRRGQTALDLAKERLTEWEEIGVRRQRLNQRLGGSLDSSIQALESSIQALESSIQALESRYKSRESYRPRSPSCPPGGRG